MPDKHVIMIAEPEAGQSLHVSMQPEGLYQLAFAIESSTLEQCGQDVRVQFESGAQIMLHGFFSAAEERDFTLELQDGVRLSGRDMVEVLALSLKDFRTDGAAACAAPAAFAPGDGGEKSLALEDLLEAPQAPLFAEPPENERAEGGTAPPSLASALADATYSAQSAAFPAGQKGPGESADERMLALLRMDL